jgi:hypothetical protein
MTQTIAQNILINSKANDRRSNYGQHPLTTFKDLDDTINSNTTYNTILFKLDKLESTYNNTLDELDILISDCRQVSLVLQQEKDLLNLIDTYTYTVPNKVPFITLINTINSLIQDCNNIINNINNRAVNNVYTYTNVVVLDAISSSAQALISKEWLANYLGTLPTIPKIKKINSTLICNSDGEIIWQ